MRRLAMRCWGAEGGACCMMFVLKGCRAHILTFALTASQAKHYLRVDAVERVVFAAPHLHSPKILQAAYQVLNLVSLAIPRLAGYGLCGDTPPVSRER